ncbi:hypothetical protein C8R47DRAFT_1148428 [Mycena vitilis]|nr:hypothetical protein C8R47DRAFT_1148428 [Mycena vitilis]
MALTDAPTDSPLIPCVFPSFFAPSRSEPHRTPNPQDASCRTSERAANPHRRITLLPHPRRLGFRFLTRTPCGIGPLALTAPTRILNTLLGIRRRSGAPSTCHSYAYRCRAASASHRLAAFDIQRIALKMLLQLLYRLLPCTRPCAWRPRVKTPTPHAPPLRVSVSAPRRRLTLCWAMRIPADSVFLRTSTFRCGAIHIFPVTPNDIRYPTSSTQHARHARLHRPMHAARCRGPVAPASPPRRADLFTGGRLRSAHLAVMIMYPSPSPCLRPAQPLQSGSRIHAASGMVWQRQLSGSRGRCLPCCEV